MDNPISVSAVSGSVTALGGTKRHFARLRLSVSGSTNQKSTATTLLLDCSGSMANSLAQVKADASKYVAELRDNEYVSMVIYSGHGEARLIASPTQTTTEGRRLVQSAIEDHVRVLSTTVFSEPLKLVMEKITKCHPNFAHNVVLFTDGCAVPQRWTPSEEQDRSAKIAKELGNMDAALSVIAYGPHYDQAFLEELHAANGNLGIYRHISDIDNFGATVTAIREIFERSTPIQANLQIQSKDKIAVGQVVRTAPEVLNVGAKGKLSLSRLFDDGADLFVELPSDTSKLMLEGDVNGKRYTEDIPCFAASVEDQKAYLHLLAALACLRGNDEEAAEYLKLAGEQGLADRVGQAYSPLEQSEMRDLLRRAFVGKEFIGAGLKPQGPNLCVLNVMRALIEDDSNVVFIPNGAYKRGGLQKVDPRIVEDPHGKTIEVYDYFSTEGHANFGVKTRKSVLVRPESGNGRPVPMKVFRDYHIIRGGNLILTSVEAILSKATFDEFCAAGVITATQYDASKVYTLKFTGMPLISRTWASPMMVEKIPGLLAEEADLEAANKLLKKHLAGLPLPPPMPTTSSPNDIYESENLEDSTAAVETYQAECVEYRLKGYKPKPVNKEEVVSMPYDELEQKIRSNRRRLRSVRNLVRSIQMAVELARPNAIAWGEKKPLPRSDKKQVQTAQLGNVTLERLTWTEECECNLVPHPALRDFS